MSNEVRVAYRFSDDRHIKFVKLYGSEPCLWNRRPYLWGARQAAYKRIQMGINADADATEEPLTLQAIKTKIKNMRTRYHLELRKITAKPSYKPRGAWFEPLHKFLAPFVSQNTIGGNVKVSKPMKPLRRLQVKLPRLKPIKLLPACDSEVDKFKIKVEPDQQVLISATSPPPLHLRTPPPQSRPPTPDPPHRIDTPQNSSMAASSLTLERPRVVQALGEDEFTYFGLSVAAQLRCMPLSNAMIMMSKIQIMLSKERRSINGDTTEMALQ